MILIKRLFIVVFLAASTLASHAQNMEFGLYGGVSYYLGDLNPSKHFLLPQIGYGILGRFNFDSRWSVKLSAYRGKVKGNSDNTKFLPGRNLNFESPVTDVSAVAEFNFFPYVTGSGRNYFTPYIYGGVGFFFFNPQSNGERLQPLGTEGQNAGYDGRSKYSLFSFEIPFGLGVKYSIGKKIGLALFWEMHKTFTDYIDDVSTTYYLNGTVIDPANASEILSDPARNHQPGMQRGNSKSMDWYSFSGVTVTYKFNLPGSKRCRDLKIK